jgi:hypothetical protein
MPLFLEWLEVCRTVCGNFYGRVTHARKTFRILLIDIDYFEGELCVSDDPEYSGGADEESEPSSIPIHTTLGSRRCQSHGPLKKPANYLDGRSINKYCLAPTP